VVQPEVFVRFTTPGLWDETAGDGTSAASGVKQLKDESTRDIIATLCRSLVDHVILYKERDQTIKQFRNRMERAKL